MNTKNIHLHSLLTPKKIAHFWKKVEVLGWNDCWTWKASLNRGYASYNLGGQRRAAYRIAWMIENGPIPEGMCILHKCDNPSCVNPEHLFTGTQNNNVHDCIAKRRNTFGIANGLSKLNPSLVAQIRELHEKCEKQNKLSRMFNVCQSTIWQVVNRKTWVHI